MNTTLQTVRVVATDEASQGAFVVINEADFDSAVHRLYEEAPAAEEVLPKTKRAKAASADSASEIQGA